MSGLDWLSLAYACSLAAALAAATSAWRRRRGAPAAPYLAAAMVAFAVWAAVDLVFTRAGSPQLQRAAILAVVPAAAVAVATFFALATTIARCDLGPGRVVVGLLAVEPVAMTVAALTNSRHGLLGQVAERGTWPHILQWDFGPVFWAHTVYCYLLMGTGLLRLLRSRAASPEPFRTHQTVLLLGTTLPAVANVVTLLSQVRGWDWPDYSSIPFVVTGAALTVSMTRRGLLTLVPVARDQVFDTVDDGIVVVDRDDRVIDVNASAERTLRLLHPDLPAVLIGTTFGRLRLGRAAAEVAAGEQRFVVDGRTFVVDVRVTALTDRRGRRAGTVLVARDITEIDALRRELAEQTVRDELTGLHNRRHLTQVLPGAVAAAAPGRPLSLLIVDVDHFKRINDGYGHGVGDDFLVAAAHVLRSCTGPGETVARYGGEEFVVLLPGLDAGAARVRAELFRTTFAELAVPTERGPVRATISLGVATCPGPVAPDDLLQAADRALYVAKSSGRDRVESAPPFGAVAPALR